MESSPSPTAGQKICPRCGQPMAAWRNQCEACSVQLTQLPPQLQWRGAHIQRPGFVTFYVVISCLGAVAQIAMGLIAVAFPVTEDLAVAGGFFWLMILPGLATLGICVTGLWYMRLWSWILTVVQLSVALLLTVGSFLFAVTAMVIGGVSAPASAVLQGLVAFVIIGGSLLWFLTHRRDFVTTREPINKTHLLLSSVLGGGLALLLTAGSLAALWFFLSQQQSDFHVSLATSLLLPIIPVIWMINGAMVSIWLYQRLAAVARVTPENGAIVGITTGVISALCLGLVMMLLVVFTAGFLGSNAEPLPGFAQIETTGMIALGWLAISLIFALPGSFFGWIGGSLGVHTQKKPHPEAALSTGD